MRKRPKENLKQRPSDKNIWGVFQKQKKEQTRDWDILSKEQWGRQSLS